MKFLPRNDNIWQEKLCFQDGSSIFENSARYDIFIHRQFVLGLSFIWFFSNLSNLAFILSARCVVVLSECLLRLLSFEIRLQFPSLRTFVAFRLCIALGAFLGFFFGRAINDSTIPYTCARTAIEKRVD